MEYKIQPEKWQCPECLRDIGIIGRWVAKTLGNRTHPCDYSNVVREETQLDVVNEHLNTVKSLNRQKYLAAQEIDWYPVIDKYVQLVLDETAKLDKQAEKIPFKLELKTVRHPRGLAFQSHNGNIFLNHILYPSYETVNTHFLISMLNNRKSYTSLWPKIIDVELDPENIVFPKEWRGYIIPSHGSLALHLADRSKISYFVPIHLREQALNAANKMLQTGKTQIIDYKPENADAGTAADPVGETGAHIDRADNTDD